ncbi:MotA/TolQ/ExbB proton channel family protein [Draconibacterium halophilum]|uniref:MotA/TolQ/ExbB proton channel family protein n=1 Tax=Draconibacterium halophilum TaxID=2706887 RepID=A0A6C0RFI9_9BACT|nr:MotA/TolQ/ExbB proton channel family protein [Draconibacterium halophilum]QIA08293.1 MotA/TolQ/ExbB proton channel family protein [Draconibacterium halophilum]
MFNLLMIQADLPQEMEAMATEPEGISTKFIDLAMKGGWIMLPILFLSVVAVYIFFDRYFAIKKAGRFDSSLLEKIKVYITTSKIDAAIALCRSNPNPASRMLEKGISRIGRPLTDVNAAIENVGNLEISKLEKGLPVLASVAGGAPMIGFLGTVMGMIQAFYDMSNAGNNIDVTLLSTGIYQAMVTTVAGLIVGIIAYFAYNILVANVEKVVFKMEATTSEFMDLLNEPA